MTLNRRTIIVGATASLIAAPAVVRAASLMPVRGIVLPSEPVQYNFAQRLYLDCVRRALARGWDPEAEQRWKMSAADARVSLMRFDYNEALIKLRRAQSRAAA